ncbi:MAG: hypothetical protein H7Z12_05505 [Rhodospirillaceae bacterium]|nr:hypothetical protein [Rhodospirillales bacterium]
MIQQKIGLLVISPMIVGTAVLLMREGAMGIKGVIAVTLAVSVVAGFLFFTL